MNEELEWEAGKSSDGENDKNEGLEDRSLIICTQRGDLDGMKRHLLTGIDVNITDEFGNTALHYACEWDSVDLVDILLSYKCKTTLRNKNLQTPMMIAIAENSIKMVQFLLINGVKPEHVEDESVETELNLACRLGNMKIVQLLLNSEQQSILRRLDISRSITSNLIGEKPDCKIVKLLLIHGGNPNYKFKNRDSPIHLALDCGKFDICSILIEYNAFLGSKNSAGLTPCMRVVELENLHLLKLILSTGADIGTRSSRTNETAYDMAKRVENFEIISEIENYLQKT